ncbi:MAG: hypothetical protein JW833_05955 [Prolixibacteraceae bacterium]|nr:hypothetical protein [Prolixibacteraceae bacterium]
MKNHNKRYYIKFIARNKNNLLNVSAKSIFALTPENAVATFKRVIAQRKTNIFVEILKVSEIPICLQNYSVVARIKFKRHGERDFTFSIKEECEGDAKSHFERIIQPWKNKIRDYRIIFII